MNRTTLLTAQAALEAGGLVLIRRRRGFPSGYELAAVSGRIIRPPWPNNPTTTGLTIRPPRAGARAPDPRADERSTTKTTQTCMRDADWAAFLKAYPARSGDLA